LFACRLISAATVIRLRRNAELAGARLDDRSLDRACWDAQERFLRQFEGADEWISYMAPRDPPD
jgi:hypothetical protein